MVGFPEKMSVLAVGYPVQFLHGVWKSSKINMESFGNPGNLLNGSSDIQVDDTLSSLDIQ